MDSAYIHTPKHNTHKYSELELQALVMTSSQDLQQSAERKENMFHLCSSSVDSDEERTCKLWQV